MNQDSNTKVSLRNVVIFAGAYCAFSIGSGYATGQEILQFFGAFGPQGIIGCFVSMLIFAFLGGALMQKGYDLKLKYHTQVFHYYCGKYIGTFLEWVTILFLFSVVSIMIAGTGAVASEYFALPGDVGSVFMALLCILSILLGLMRLADVIGSMGPVIIFFTIGIGILTVLNANTDWAKGWDVLYDLRSTKSWWFSTYDILDSAWFSGVLYASCMVFGSIPFLTGLGGKANSRREAFLGGFLGGVALMIASALMMAAMLCFPAEVAKLQVPNLFLAQQFAPALALIFSVILLLGIYSTAAPMFWVVINKLEQWLPNKTVKMAVTVVLGVVAYFGAQIGFGKLIGFLYPLMGQVGVLMIIVVLVKVFILKDNKDPGLEREE